MSNRPVQPRKRLRFSWKSALVFGVSLLLAFAVGEWAFRRMIFGDSPAFENLRQPSLYAHEGKLEYWLLHHRLSHGEGAPEHPHPWLGWLKPQINANSYLHEGYAQIKGRRPVLLYGDSFAECMPEVTCFQAILNADSAFNQHHYFLNYGVGGYGVDQIHLLMRQTAHRYQRPFVVFSLLTQDMDRTGLPFRVGVKPYYAIEGDSLALKGVPISGTADSFAQANPIGINSYLMRTLAYSRAFSWLPTPVSSRMKGIHSYFDERRALNLAVLDSALAELRRTDCDFVFFIFQNNRFANFHDSGDDWHVVLLNDWLERNKVPHIWSADLLDRYANDHGVGYGELMIPGNGHPTTLANQVMADAMKEAVLASMYVSDSTSADNQPPWKYEAILQKSILNMEGDTTWLNQVSKDAMEKGVSLEEMKRLNSIYMLNEGGVPFRW